MQHKNAVILFVILSVGAVWPSFSAAWNPWSAKLVAVAKVGMRVHLGESEQQAFVEVIHNYAEHEHFETIDNGAGLTDEHSQPIVNLSLVRKDGIEITVFGMDADALGYSIAVFAKKENAPWPIVARQLITALRAKWPTAITVSYPETKAAPPEKIPPTYKVFMQVHLGEDTLTQFKSVIREYAKRWHFQIIVFKGPAVDMNGNAILGLKLERNDGVRIDVQGLNIDLIGYFIRVDATKKNAPWRLAADQLAGMLRSKWPNAVTVEYVPGAS